MSLDLHRGLVSPLARAYDTKEEANGLGTFDGARIGLVDSMLNPGSLWGQGILDAVERFLSSRSSSVVFGRVSRPPVGGPPHGIWASSLAREYTAVVAAVGD